MRIEWRTCFRIGASIFLLYLAVSYWKDAAGILAALFSASLPLLVGCVIAYLLNIIMSFYERHYFVSRRDEIVTKSRRPVCLIASYITLLAIAALILSIVVPQLAACLRLFFKAVPDVMEILVGALEKWSIMPENISKAIEDINWQSTAGRIVKILTSGIGSTLDVVINTVSSVVSGIVTALLALIFSIYLLMGKEKLGQQVDRLMKHYMKESWYEKAVYLLSVLDDCFHRYFVGQCTEAVILGLLCMLGMIVLRLPYGAMIGALVGFTALIPVAGAYIGAGVGAFMILTESSAKAAIFLIFIVLLQQLEGNLIYPRVVGSSMGLPAIWVLAAVTVGGGIMGIPGMLLGVPIAAALYRLLREELNQEPDTEEEGQQEIET